MALRSYLASGLRLTRSVNPCARAYGTNTKVFSKQHPRDRRPSKNLAPQNLSQAQVRLDRSRKQLRDGHLFHEAELQTSPVTLRDSCRCHLCVDPSDRQRNFSYAEIPSDIEVKSYVVEGDSVIVEWTKDVPGFPTEHRSIFDTKAIKSLANSRQNPAFSVYGRPRMLWAAKDFAATKKDVSYDDFMNDTDTLAEVLHLLWRNGLVFIRNVPESESSVSDLVQRIGPLPNTFYGPTWDVRSVPQAKNVAYTSKHLGFHMDLLYMRDPPGFQFLHCLHNSCTGGESRFADTFKAIDTIYATHPQHIHSLKWDIRYEYDNDGHFYSFRRPVIKMQDQYSLPPNRFENATSPKFMQHVEHCYWSPPFVGSIPDGSQEATRLLVEASKAFSTILEQPESVYEEKMDPGTCVIFDNLRVVHARNAFDMNSGKRWLKGAYLGFQDFYSKASSLRDKMPAVEGDPEEWVQTEPHKKW